MILKNAYVLTDDFEFCKTDIEISGEKIAKTGVLEQGRDLSGKFILPGLVDIHTHGAVGTDTMETDFDFAKWQNYLFNNGVTTFLPSTVSESYESLLYVLEKLGNDSRVEGINLEGPYLEQSKKGAHKEDAIRPGSIGEMEKFMEISKGKIKITTVAPEIEGNIKFIKELKKRFNIAVSMGHSAAGYDDAAKAIKAGVTNVTHTFNAMGGLNHREPGILGAALIDENVFCEVISDGVHLHPAIVKLLYKILSDKRMVLVSDSMAATGLSDGIYSLGRHQVTVSGGVARIGNGAIAGSTKNLMQIVKTAISFGIPFNYAVKMASKNPASVIGMQDEIGSIKAGKRADLVVVDEDLNVLMTIKSGKVVYENA